MNQYPHILSRVFDTPLLIQESKLRTILTFLAGRADFRVDRPADLDVPERADLKAALQGPGRRVGFTNGYLMVNNTAILEVTGTLVHRGDAMDAASGLTSYELLSARLARMMADEEVTSILMVIDSYGGDATSGVFDLADQIRTARDEKPIYGFAHDVATSAAYMLGSAATELYLPEMGVIGSIGVVTAHMDVSKKAAKEGVAMTYIYAGDHKIDGNPFEPLPKPVRNRIQSRVDKVYGMFVARVAANRSMTEEAVAATEAAVYYGKEAIDAGLADGVMPFDEYLGAVLETESGNRAGIGPSMQSQQETTMSDKDKQSKPGSPAPEAKPEALSADQVIEQHPAAAAELAKAGAQAERQRISGILQHKNAKGREQLASHLAFNTDLDVEAAAGMLAASPMAAKLESFETSSKSPFEAAMDRVDNPDIGVDAEDGDDPTPQAAAASAVEQARKLGLIQ